MLSEYNQIIKEIVDNNVFTIDNKNGLIYGKRGRVIGYTGKENRYYISYKCPKRHKKVNLSVHRIIAYNKFGDVLFNYETVDHIDGNCQNNSADNLQLLSSSNNVIKNLTVDTCQKGENNRNAKLSNENVSDIKWLLNNTNLNNKQIAMIYGVTHQMISKIKLGYNWSFV